MKKYTLYVDESGSIDLDFPDSGLYILCGCSVEEKNRNEIKILADQVKFKYWGKTDIVFHSREISRSQGQFSIFKENKLLKKEFTRDLLRLLRNSNYSIFPVTVDKSLAKKHRWKKEKVIQQTANYIISNYLRFILTKRNSSGKIVIEFSTESKDRFYISSFNYFTSPGCKDLNFIDYKIIQKKLTSLSFVTKHNHDIEEQIADMMAYAVKCRYLKQKDKTYKLSEYEKNLLKILDSKLIKVPKKPNKRKKEFFEKIESFGTLP